MVAKGPTKALCAYAFEALDAYLHNRKHKSLSAFVKPEDTPGPSPLFVTWYKTVGKSKDLRGCIGTYEELSIEKGVAEYALIAALHDTRFSPIQLSELPQLSCEINLLFDFEDASSPFDWDLGTHGIRIHFSDPMNGGRRSATFLPKVAEEQGWTKEQTLEHLVLKAGYYGSLNQILDKLRVVRYQSAISSLDYDDFVAKRY